MITEIRVLDKLGNKWIFDEIPGEGVEGDLWVQLQNAPTCMLIVQINNETAVFDQPASIEFYTDGDHNQLDELLSKGKLT